MNKETILQSIKEKKLYDCSCSGELLTNIRNNKTEKYYKDLFGELIKKDIKHKVNEFISFKEADILIFNTGSNIDISFIFEKKTNSLFRSTNRLPLNVKDILENPTCEERQLTIKKDSLMYIPNGSLFKINHRDKLPNLYKRYFLTYSDLYDYISKIAFSDLCDNFYIDSNYQFKENNINIKEIKNGIIDFNEKIIFKKYKMF